MRGFSRIELALALTLLGCRSAPQPPAGSRDSVAITASTQPWQLQVLLDSSPRGRVTQARVAAGTVAADFSAYQLDFQPVLGRPMAPGIALHIMKGSDRPFRFTLGDLSSDHDVVTFEGRPVRPDSVVGTWQEILYCCGARGRFTLWRSSR
jgi:hypothetical protein